MFLINSDYCDFWSHDKTVFLKDVSIKSTYARLFMIYSLYKYAVREVSLNAIDHSQALGSPKCREKLD